MGYHTEFRGQFDLDKPLTKEHYDYLEAFSKTRRMERDPLKASTLPDPIRQATGLPIGPGGAYFVGGAGFMGQDSDCSVLNHNLAGFQPGLWCQWIPGEQMDTIEWDGGEKFYEYIEWIKFLIEHFLQPWGYVVDGCVEWRGDEWDDTGAIIVTNNEVSVQYGDE